MKALIMGLFAICIFANAKAQSGPDTIKYSTPLTFCAGGQVVLTADGAAPGDSYLWFRNNNPISNNDTLVATLAGTYRVRVTRNGSPTNYPPINVVLTAGPNASFNFIIGGCLGDSVAFTPTVSGGTPPYSYLWNFGDGTTSTAANPVHSYTNVVCGTAEYDATLTVTDALGCTRTVSEEVSFNTLPQVSIRDQNIFAPFSNCGNSPTENNAFFNITVLNTSPDSNCIALYTINWGDGFIDDSVTFPATHTYALLGTYQMTVTGTTASGCSNSQTYTVLNQSNPAVGISSFGSTIGCAPYGFWFKLDQYQNNSPGTTYTWDFGDGTPNVTWTMPINVDSIFHVFDTTSCTRGDKQFTVRVTARNGCDSTSASVNNIRIFAKPRSRFTAPVIACVGSPVNFANGSTLAWNNPNCSQTTMFYWHFGDLGTGNTSTSTNPTHIYTSPGTYLVTLISEGYCGRDTASQLICIVAQPQPSFTLDQTKGCGPLNVTATNTSPAQSQCDSSVRLWTVTYAGAYCGNTGDWSFTNGTSDTSANPSFQFINPGVYTIQLAITNACGTFTFNRTVTIKAPPTVSLLPLGNSCGVLTVNPQALVTNCADSSLVYSWNFPGGSPSSSNAANPGTITYPGSGTYLISLSVFNECGSEQAAQSFSIGDVPVVTAPGNLELCEGSPTGNLDFTSNSGIVSWTNSNPSIGLAASGTGSIPSFIVTNPTNSTQVATITVSSTTGSCTGTQTFTITVNPKPATPPVADITYCQNSVTQQLSVTADSGKIIQWYSSATGGTGSSTAPTPSSSTPGLTTYYVSQVDTATGCESDRDSIRVTVSPTPTIGSYTSINPSSCNTPTGSITLTGIAPGTYTVTYIKNGVLFTLTSQTPVNGEITIANLSSGTYSDITVLLGNCGSAMVGPITLSDPNAPVTPVAVANSPICSGATINLMATSSTAGVTYTWSGPNAFTSNLQNPQITNASTTASGIYSVTATLNGCSSGAGTVNVVVNPTPVVGPYTRTICSGSSFLVAPVSGGTTVVPPGTTYSWGVPVSSPLGAITGGSPATGAAAIGQILVNTTNAPATLTYTVIPQSGACIGAPFTIVVTVNPQPLLPNVYDTICSGGSFSVTPMGAMGVQYTWTNPVSNPAGAITGGAAQSALQSSINGTLVNTTAAQATMIYTVTPRLGSCAGPTFNVFVTVNPRPAIQPVTTSICTGGSFNVTPSHPSNIIPAGTTYSWTAPVVTGGVTGGSAGSGTSISGTLINNTAAVQTATYSVIPMSGNCAGQPFTVTVSVNPNSDATMVIVKDTSCAPFPINGSILSAQTGVGNGTYRWYVNGTFIGTGVAFPGYTITTPNTTVTIKLVTTSQYGCAPDSMEHNFYTILDPLPAFTLSDTVGCGPLSVTINNTTPNANLFSYYWNFGNGNTSTAIQPGTQVYQPAAFGADTVYTVTMTTMSDCDTIILTQYVRVKAKPHALFTPNSSTGCSPMTVTFNNISQGFGNTYTWDFGDGSPLVNTTSTGQISHVYTTPIQDTFYVRLMAFNACGSDTMTYALVVAPNNIALDFAINGSQQSGCSPHAVAFFNNSQGASTFTWNFGDGTIINTTDNIDTVYHTYLVPGNYTVTLSASNSCSVASTTETVTVYPVPVADFSANSVTSCLAAPVVFTNNSSNATSYLWSFGDGTTSNLTNPTKLYSAPGIYTVTLIAYRFNPGGTFCSDTTSMPVQILGTQTGNFSVSEPIASCAPATITFTNSNQPSVSAAWNFGDGTTGIGNVVTHTYTQPGTYQVTLTSVSLNGCTYISVRTVVVQGPSGSWTHTSGYLCNGSTATFQVQANSTDSLIFYFGDGTSVTTTNNVVQHTYANPGTYFPSVVIKNTAGCSVTLPAMDTIQVDKLNAGFTTTALPLCGSTTVKFQDTSYAFFGISIRSWDFGDGTTGTGAVQNHSYTTSGNYPIRLIVTSVGGCSDTIYRTISVVVRAKPQAAIVGPQVSCVNYTNTYSANVQSIDSVSFIKWMLSNGATSTSPVFSYNFTQAGNYTLQLITGTIYGCYDTTSTTIQVNGSPIISTTNDLTLCRGNSTVLNTTSTGVIQYNWTPVQGLSCTSCPSPTATPMITTTYYVTGSNAAGCMARDSVTISVVQPTVMNVSAGDTICRGSSINLLASGAATYQWFPATSLSSSTISNPIASPTATINYMVVGSDAQNCFRDTGYVLVTVGQIPTVNLGPDLSLPTGAVHQLSSTVTNGPIKTWAWTPATDLTCSTCPLPSVRVKKDISYVVTVTNNFGCVGKDSINIKTFCESTQVFIPNAFTPDNDGVNDIIYVRGSGIAMVKTFRIFNRWGEVVFERANFPANDRSSAWDGKVRGVVGGPDVFVYTAEVICDNGSSFIYKGNISIIK